jgi:uncharacterized protein YfbU (UPF0304 family)
MAKLKLTDIERLTLANQYQILAALHEDEKYARMAETLRDGYEWLYSQYFDQLSSNLPEHQAEHVLAILGIYSDLKDSYAKLDDKSGIEESQIIFPGFDGNNEVELLGFSGALRKHDRFSSTIGEHVRNSHMPTTEIYQRMINCWRELGQPNYPYDKQTIQEILAARIHPSHRK